MTFSFIQITDHHLGETAADFPYGYPATATFIAVMDSIAGIREKFDFIVSTGDLVNRPTDESYTHLKNLLHIQPTRQMPGPHLIHYGKLRDFPIYLLPGNHDERSAFFTNLYEAGTSEGEPALFNTSFLHKGVNFICLDWGGLDQAQASGEMLSFLKSELEKDTPAVLLMHHNIIPLGTAWLDRFIADDIEQFYRCLDGKNVLGILCGHLHTTYEREINGIPVLGLRSTGFQFRFNDKPVMTLMPLHYRIIRIDDRFRLSSRIIEVPLPDEL